MRPESLVRMQKDQAELSGWLVRLIDAQLLAIATCESIADDEASFRYALADLGRVYLKVWGAHDEATALRAAYERSALRDEVEKATVTNQSRDLLERWRSAMGQAVAPLGEYVKRWGRS
jgi:hypothetical protein